MPEVRPIDANALIKALLSYPIVSGGLLQDIREQPTLEYPMCPGCGEPMRPFFHENPTGKCLAIMTCDCGWVSPTAEGNSPQEALGTAYLLAIPRCKAVDNTKDGNEPKSHDPQKCACYRINGSGEPICMGTKELDPCRGSACERWRKREE